MRIRNWERFQQYKDRQPKWIKVYRDLLNDVEWFELDGDTAKLLVNLWLLAAETEANDGSLPPIRTISFRLHLSEAAVSKGISRLAHWIVADDTELYEVVQKRTLDKNKRRVDTEENKNESRAQAREEFEGVFWPAWPNKVGKPKAFQTFIAARRKHSLETIFLGLERYIAAKPPDRQWLNPATFLNQERFLDEPARASPKLSQFQQAVKDHIEEVDSRHAERDSDNGPSRRTIRGASSASDPIAVYAAPTGLRGDAEAPDASSDWPAKIYREPDG